MGVAQNWRARANRGSSIYRGAILVKKKKNEPHYECRALEETGLSSPTLEAEELAPARAEATGADTGAGNWPRLRETQRLERAGVVSLQRCLPRGPGSLDDLFVVR